MIKVVFQVNGKKDVLFNKLFWENDYKTGKNNAVSITEYIF